MSGYRAACPACGASLVFSLGASLLKVCEHCGVAVARKGAHLESYGRAIDAGFGDQDMAALARYLRTQGT